jgi:uncharacterized membrane protein YvbJ
MMTDEKISVTFPESVRAIEEGYEDLQLALDKKEIEELLSNYITYFSYAMNFGHMGYIAEYIDPESSLYNQLFDFTLYASQHTIWEELKDYRIDRIEAAEDGIYYVVCEECFTTYTNDYSVGITNVFKNTYTVRKTANGFSIIAVDFLNLLNRL